MPNVRSGNSYYIETTTALTVTGKPKAVSQVVVTATSANAIIVIQDGSTVKMELRVATSGETKSFEFPTPVIFNTSINPATVTNCRATVIW